MLMIHPIFLELRLYLRGGGEDYVIVIKWHMREGPFPQVNPVRSNFNVTYFLSSLVALFVKISFFATRLFNFLIHHAFLISIQSVSWI